MDFFLWEASSCGQLTKQSSAHGVVVGGVPLLMQKAGLSQWGLLPSHSPCPGLGRNVKPRSLLAIKKKKNPDKIIPFIILAGFQFS